MGLYDLKHVGDLYDFHLAFPYVSWTRDACTDAMGCKIGQKLFAKLIHLFLIDTKLVSGDFDKEFKQLKEVLGRQAKKEKNE